LCAEYAVQNFIRWYRERDDQPHGRAFVGDGDCGDVELRHDVIDRLLVSSGGYYSAR
jgi:hypothetical protein